MNIVKKIWKKLEDLHIFERFIRIRYGLVMWLGLAVLGFYVIFYYVLGSGIIYIQTLSVDKATRMKVIKLEKEKARKYDKIEKENSELKKYKDTDRLKDYRMDLVFRLYDYYKNSGTLQIYYWINKKLFDEVYNGAMASKSLNPSFNKVYFGAFPAEESALKTIVIRKNPTAAGEQLEKLIMEEEERYLDLVYPLVIYGKCKKESNFFPKCETNNYRKDDKGNFILDTNGKKQFKSVDQGIVQMNYCGQCGGDKAKCERIKGKPMGDGYCTRAWVENELKKKRPDIARRDIFDIEKNLSLRAIHTEDLIKHYKAWCFIDWDFTGMCKRVMWTHYYPEMFNLVSY